MPCFVMLSLFLQPSCWSARRWFRMMRWLAVAVAAAFELEVPGSTAAPSAVEVRCMPGVIEAAAATRLQDAWVVQSPDGLVIRAAQSPVTGVAIIRAGGVQAMVQRPSEPQRREQRRRKLTVTMVATTAAATT